MLDGHVTVRLGSRRFAPRWWAILVYVAVLVAMLSLGRWQLARADEKIALLESAELARSAAPIALERVDDMDAAVEAHRRVRVRGTWEEGRQFLWDNRAHGGRAGYEAIVPVRLADGRLALVNRGWLAPGPSREVLPDVSFGDADDGSVDEPADGSANGSADGSANGPAERGGGVPTDGPTGRSPDVAPIELVGLLSRPSKGFSSGAALAPGDAWPRVLQHFDYAAIEAALGEPIVPAVVQAQVADDTGDFAVPETPVSADAPLAADVRAALLTPNWRPAASGPEKHYGYAFQWFAMAAALTVIFVVVNLSRKESP